MARIKLLDLPIDNYTMDEATAWLEARIEGWRAVCATRQEGVVPRSLKTHVVTINPEIAWSADQNPLLKNAVCEAGLVVPDGIGVVLAARLKHHYMPERVAGFDLMQRLLSLAATRDYSAFFLGAAPGVAEEAAAEASRRYPGLRVVGTADGYFREEEEAELLQRISAAGTDLLFCALGPPRPAEIWINRHLDALKVAVAMGVGGSFNVLAGRVPRAPLWMQKSGLEWLHRVWCDPKRIGRLAAIPKFLWKVLLN